MSNVITILGSGTSTGIPMLGCDCRVCTSTNPKNKRLRTSVHIKSEKSSFIVDTGPDLRAQLLNNKIKEIDFAIITHDHADHTHGIDDLRPLCFGPPVREIPIYTYKECLETLTAKFPYIFQADKIFTKDRPPLGGGIPRLKLYEVKAPGTETINDEQFEFLLLDHGYGNALGFIHEKMAYIIDCHSISDEQIEILKNRDLELLIIDCVTDTEHKTHLNVDKAFDYISKIGPKQAGLIHMNHSLEHEELSNKAKESFDFPVFPVYDSMRLKY
jgi:phosphoribosyl 1,2-cyclic phosphate phosphodiesterase